MRRIAVALVALGTQTACGSAAATGPDDTDAQGKAPPDAGADTDLGTMRDGSQATTKDGPYVLPDAGPPPPDPCIAAGTCPPGTWVDVTPANAGLMNDTSTTCANYGTLSVQVNSTYPGTVYMEVNCRGVWKSSDYGLTWTGPVNTGKNGATVSDCQGGIAVPPRSATQAVYQSCIAGEAIGFWVSSNGGTDWTKYTVAPSAGRQDFYPPVVDPYDANHLLMAGHEDNFLVQSVNGGQTWTEITVDPKMEQTSGSAAFVFIDNGNPAETRNTWLYSPQATGGMIGTWRTDNGGTTWTQVDTNEKEHSYWQIYQPDTTSGVVFMAGVYSTLGNGVLRSTDYGVTWKHVGLPQNENIVFGTPKHVYAMDAYSDNVETADAPGTGTWTAMTTPVAMWSGTSPSGALPGAVTAAVTFDGTYYIILSANWNSGIWRYLEPLK